MNDRQENLLNMYRTVITICDANATVFPNPSIFGTYVTSLKSSVQVIANTRQSQELATKGITLDKLALKRELVAEAAVFCSVISAFAHQTGHLDLREAVAFSERELDDLRTEALLSVCRIVLAKTDAFLSHLAPYGISQSRRDVLEELIEEFHAAIPGTSAARSNRRSATLRLKELFDSVNVLLTNQMDPAVKVFRATQPGFVRAYTAARKVIPSGVRIETEGSLTGRVRVKLTGMALEGVRVELMNTTLTGLSAADGTYRIDRITAGVYEVRATKTGYKPYSASGKTVASKQVLTLDIEMEVV